MGSSGALFTTLKSCKSSVGASFFLSGVQWKVLFHKGKVFGIHALTNTEDVWGKGK